MTDKERFEATAREIILRQWGRIDSCGTLGLLHKLIASALSSAFEDGRKAGYASGHEDGSFNRVFGDTNA